jgi:hypothetical protein
MQEQHVCRAKPSSPEQRFNSLRTRENLITVFKLLHHKPEGRPASTTVFQVTTVVELQSLWQCKTAVSLVEDSEFL